MKRAERPTTTAQLNERLEEEADEFKVPIARVRRMLCTLIVSQILPNSVAIKGGMGVKLRLGERGTRATADLDVSARERGEAFENDFSARLSAGWGAVPASKGQLRKDPAAPDRVAFTGVLRRRPTHDPGLEQPQYVMHPYRVTLSFLGREWAALDVEVSDPEIEPDALGLRGIDEELVTLSERFGFGTVEPVQLIRLEHQIAQKLHAVTDPAYARAHDLVDLQLLWAAAPDIESVREFSVRTFACRRQQAWPPIPLRDMEGWDVAYAGAHAETEVDDATPVARELGSARRWLTELAAG